MSSVDGPLQALPQASGSGTPAASPKSSGARRAGLRKGLLWLGLGLAALVVLFFLWRIFAPKKAKPAAPQAIPVGVATVAVGNMNVDLFGLGTVTPEATVTVQTQINGQLMQVGYQEGQVVRKGQFLAQIDPRPYQAALAQAQGALIHDTGLLNQAKSDLARYEILDRQNSISKQQVADQTFLVQQDQGTVMQDQAAVQTAKLNLAYCHIVSPVTGRTGLRLVDAGNYVQAASATGLVVITQLQPITVIFVLPEDDIPALAQQMHNGQSLAVTAYGRGNGKAVAQGVLSTVDNTVDTTTGTVKLRARFANADLALFPNEFVNARLRLKTLRGVTEVPVRAVQTGAPGSFVYVVKPDDTVAVQAIKTGVTDGDNVQVLSGLKAGDKVVTDGDSLLKSGAKVRIASSGAKRTGTVNNGPGAPPGEQPQDTGKANGGGESQS